MINFFEVEIYVTSWYFLLQEGGVGFEFGLEQQNM
jgi:hypothetical protein